MLDVINITKNYRNGKRALSNVNLTFMPGIVGLLGPNGAGKSSLMRIIATITRPTSGQIKWEGEDVATDPDKLRRVLGYLPQDFGVYPNLSAEEFLGYMAAIKGLSPKTARSRIDELLELVNLAQVRKRPLGKFSGGMRQRVGIAQALLNDPKLIIVDEPTAGLDPEERVRFRNLLGDLASDRIIILSTHIVSDIEAVAESIAILSEGELLKHESPETLLQQAQGFVWEVTVSSAEIAAFRKDHLISRAVRTQDGVRLRVLSAILPFKGAIKTTPDLEDAFLFIMHEDQLKQHNEGTRVNAVSA